jgi:peroxiredoxin
MKILARIGWLWVGVLAGRAGPAGAEMVRGIVQYKDGTPAVGAVVYALDRKTSVDLRDQAFTVSEHIPRVMADQKGAFEFKDLPRPAEAFLVRDLEDRFAFAPVPAAGELIRIVVHRPARVTGSLWRGKTPKADTQVTADYLTDSPAWRIRYTATTNRRGTFTFPALLPGQYAFQTIAPAPPVGCCFRDVVTARVEAELAPGEVRTLRIGGSNLPHLGGRITDKTGIPLHGIWVSLDRGDEEPAEEPGTRPAVQTVWADVTGRDGRYAVYDLPPGRYQLRCFRRLVRNNSARVLDVRHDIVIPGLPTSPVANVKDIVIDLEPFMPLKIGSPAPRFMARTLAGRPFDLAGERGKMVVLHFYSRRCRSCAKDFAGYDKLLDRLGAGKLTVVGISLDESADDARKLAEDTAVRHPQIYDGPGLDGPATKTFRVADLPTTIIIDRDGKVAQLDLFEDVLSDFLDRRIKDKP